MRNRLAVMVMTFAGVACGSPLLAQPGSSLELPLSQSSSSAHLSEPLTQEIVAHSNRWFGEPPRDIHWSPDSAALYFRYPLTPSSTDDPATDPWFRYDIRQREVRELSSDEVWQVPTAAYTTSLDGTSAAWITDDDRLVIHQSTSQPRTWVAVKSSAGLHSPEMSGDGSQVQLMMGEDLYLYRLTPCPADRAGCARLQQLTQKAPIEQPPSDAGAWLEKQQLELFELARRREQHENDAKARAQASDEACVHHLRVAEGLTLDSVELTPKGDSLVLRATRKASSSTIVMSYANRSGYSQTEEARSKVGEPQNETRLGYVPYNQGSERVCESVVTFDQPAKSRQPSDSKGSTQQVQWWTLPEDSLSRAAQPGVVPHGPFFSLDGKRALAQFISGDHKDLWIAELGFAEGSPAASMEILVHDHDDAWLGGPPIQSNYWFPTLLEWLDDGSFVFASERSGWSHLYRYTSNADQSSVPGQVEALTEGTWEVRQAVLSRDRSSWLLETSREHPSDDHLYTLPAAGGELQRLTEGEGRHNGWLSPDGHQLAMLVSDSTTLPDLYVADPAPGAEERAVQLTRTGTDPFWRHQLARPEIVAIPHPDGKPVYASLYRPKVPLAERPAILHIHGGGYRQFTHRGWSVYGFDHHVGLLQYLVQQGYTVLDFDYRGGSGYGRDYRTDIYQAMGHKDVDGAVAAIDWLVANEGVDAQRVGVYGISYGGFFTLMAQFRYPGRFAAGVAIASVTDWAHYDHVWTSRILGLPYEEPEAYERSSPIEHAGGLEDPLLIVHGLLDENVQFQDAARLTRKLIELEKDFELMVYPAERHVIEDEATRLDFTRRLVAFFEANLLGS